MGRTGDRGADGADTDGVRSGGDSDSVESDADTDEASRQGIQYAYDIHERGGVSTRHRTVTLAERVEHYVIEMAGLGSADARDEAAEWLNELARGEATLRTERSEPPGDSPGGSDRFPFAPDALLDRFGTEDSGSELRYEIVRDGDDPVIDWPASKISDGAVAELQSLECHRDPPRIVPEPAWLAGTDQEARERHERRVGENRSTESERALLNASVRLRDARLAQLVDNLVESGASPGEIGTTVGGGHQLDRLLAADYSVDPRNDLQPMDFTRIAARNALRATDGIGYSLLGDSKTVADDLGPETVRAQLGALGGDLVTAPRIDNEGLPAAYDTALRDAVDPEEWADLAPAELVERLQSAARGALSEYVDLEAAETYGDLDRSRPAEAPASPAEAVAASLPSGEDRHDGVRALFETGALSAERIGAATVADLKDVAYGVDLETSAVVEPLDVDVDELAADMTRAFNDRGRELAAESANRTRGGGGGLRRGARAVLGTVSDIGTKALDAIGRSPPAEPSEGASPGDEWSRGGDPVLRDRVPPTVSADDLGAELGRESSLGDQVRRLAGGDAVPRPVEDALRRIRTDEPRLNERLEGRRRGSEASGVETAGADSERDGGRRPRD